MTGMLPGWWPSVGSRGDGVELPIKGAMGITCTGNKWLRVLKDRVSRAKYGLEGDLVSNRQRHLRRT